MKAITAELAPLLQSEDWEVFSSDEVRMDQEAVIRKCWLKKGERTIIKVDRKKQSQSYIGFLNQKNYQCHLYEMPWQNSDEVLRAMKEFLTAYPEKKICIVWDNAAFHKSKAIRDQLEKAASWSEFILSLCHPTHLITILSNMSGIRPNKLCPIFSEIHSNKRNRRSATSSPHAHLATRFRHFDLGLLYVLILTQPKCSVNQVAHMVNSCHEILSSKET